MFLRHRLFPGLALFASLSLHAQDWSGHEINLPDIGAPQSIAYGNGRFVISFNSGNTNPSKSLAYSVDGATWTFGEGANFSNSGVVLFHHPLFRTVTSNGSYQSNDGTNWTKVASLPVANAYPSGFATDGITIMFGSTSNSQTAPLYTTNFVDWSLTAPLPTTEPYSRVYGFTPVYGAGRFLLNYNAYTQDGFNQRNLVADSIDGGTSWHEATGAPSGSQAMVYGNGRFVYIDSTRILISTDGINFTAHADLGGLPTRTDKLYFAGGRFLALIDDTFYASTEGLAWSTFGTIPTDVANPSVLRLTYGNGRYMAIARKLNRDTFVYKVSVLSLERSSAPLIMSHPRSTAVYPDTPVELGVELDNAADCTYAWFKDGEPLPEATSSTLSIASAASTDDGEYHVVVSNPVGSTSSYTAFVVVLSPHTADTNGDFQLDLAELLRVIELYNTRNGTVRTGRYRAASGEPGDGFESDSSTSAGEPSTLETHHDADANRDAKISLTELLRIIELYNHREGTMRTGRYHPDPTAADGFAAGRDS